jgi:hypothetical protein
LHRKMKEEEEEEEEDRVGGLLSHNLNIIDGY